MTKIKPAASNLTLADPNGPELRPRHKTTKVTPRCLITGVLSALGVSLVGVLAAYGGYFREPLQLHRLGANAVRRPGPLVPEPQNFQRNKTWPTASRFVCRNSTSLSCPPPLIPSEAPKGYLGACMPIRDELDIEETIAYYMRLGVSMFYLYEGHAELPLPRRFPALYRKLADRKNTRYEAFDNFVGEAVHHQAFNECIEKFSPFHQFLAFLDADELVVFPQATTERNLPAFLRAFENEGGLAINWREVGSSGHDRRPAAGMVASYTNCRPLDSGNSLHVKVIGNTRYLKRMGGNMHVMEYFDDKTSVTENFDPVSTPFSKFVSVRNIMIQHYVLKSKEDFGMKVKRSAQSQFPKYWSFFEATDAECTEQCLLAQHMWPKSEGSNSTSALLV